MSRQQYQRLRSVGWFGPSHWCLPPRATRVLAGSPGTFWISLFGRMFALLALEMAGECNLSYRNINTLNIHINVISFFKWFDILLFIPDAYTKMLIKRLICLSIADYYIDWYFHNTFTITFGRQNFIAIKLEWYIYIIKIVKILRWKLYCMLFAS